MVILRHFSERRALPFTPRKINGWLFRYQFMFNFNTSNFIIYLYLSQQEAGILYLLIRYRF
jgi:hypothetical protein